MKFWKVLVVALVGLLLSCGRVWLNTNADMQFTGVGDVFLISFTICLGVFLLLSEFPK